VKNRYINIVLPTIVIVGLLVLWQIASDYNWINSALFSSPTEVGKAFLSTKSLGAHVVQSLYRLSISVFIGYSVGTISGLLISSFSRLSFLEDILAFFMSIPGISWAPIFIMLIGFGDKTINTVGALTAFFPALYNSYQGMKAIDKNLLRVSRMLEYKPILTALKVKIPAISNYLLVGLKEAFSRTWRTIIAVEMIAATMYGIGYMTFSARELLNMDRMFMGIVLSGVLYMLIDVLIVILIENQTVVKWGMKIKR